MQMRTKIAAAYSVFASICTVTSGQALAETAPAASAGIAVVGVPAASRTQLTGVLKLTVVVQTDKTIPDGTLLEFNAGANVVDQSFTNSHSVGGSAKISGGKAKVTLNIPYILVVASKTDTLSVSCGVSASVIGNETVSYSTSFSTNIALPPNGATTAVTLSGDL
jgi:hypothetical protein